MGFALPNGSHVYISGSYDTPVPFTAITNAKDAVVTVEDGHAILADDVVHISSGWSGINEVIAKVKEVTDTTITLGLIDTTDTNRFADGAGIGAIKKVASWVEIPQITELSASGGEQQTIQVQFLSDDRQRNLNTFKSPKTQTYTIAHDSTLPVYATLRSADFSQETLAVRMFIPKAAETRYYSVKLGFDDIPNTAVNAIETVSATFNLQSPAMTFYKTVV